MRAFGLPQCAVIMENELGELQAFEHDSSDGLQQNAQKVVIHYDDGAFACCMSPEEWIASICGKAFEAYKRGETSITIK